MKLIEALVEPSCLGAMKDALSAVEVFRMTVSDVTGLERDQDPSVSAGAPPVGIAGLGGGSSSGSVPGDGGWRPRSLVRVEIAVNEAFVQPTLAAIRSAQASDGPQNGPQNGPDDRTSRDGGRIHIYALRDVIRVRTGERGPEAI